MDAWHKTGAAWSNITMLSDFQERVSYDPNGNILGYKRNGNSTFAGKPLSMDSLNYSYLMGTNRLDHVSDNVPVANYSTDIDIQSGGNYDYDAIGNLIKDNAEGIVSVSWTVYGKISRIVKIDGTNISYTYDPYGNRISKVVNKLFPAFADTTWYVRDGQGKLMSMYISGNNSVNEGNLTQTEVHLYGSSRIGLLKRKLDVAFESAIDSDPSKKTMPLLGIADSLSFVRGDKIFELGNHLRNVLVTISDKKLGVSYNNSTVDYFKPQEVSAQDYYPFGMLQPERSFNTGEYRYGFNGKENDNEMKGVGNQQDYGMRIYDPRLGRFLSVDPLTRSYPMLTPYQFASNCPIVGVDQDGLEFYNSNSSRIGIGLSYNSELKLITKYSTYFRSENIPDALNDAINSANKCQNCIGSSAATVTSGELPIPLLNPFVKPQHTAEAKDIDVPENSIEKFSSIGPSAAASQTSIVPYDKKSEREQRKSKAYFTEGGSPRIAKVGLVMAAVDLAVTFIQYIGNENLKSIVRTAQNQAVNGGSKVIQLLQNAIDNGKLEKYLDNGSLVSLANYLLYGKKIEKYEVVNGTGTYVEDKELTQIGQQIWSEYITPINEKKQQEESRRERRKIVDNVGGNAGGSNF